MCRYLDESRADGEVTLYKGEITFWVIILLGIKGGLIGLAIHLISSLDMQLFSFNVSPLGFDIFLTPASLFFVVSFTIYAVGAIRSLIYVFFTDIVITNKRFFIKRGLIVRNTYELRIDRIEGSSISQGIIERILGIGSLNIQGMGTQQIRVDHLHDPVGARKAILEAYERTDF